MSVLARAATDTEKGLMRSEGQTIKLKLFIGTPPTVYSAQVDAISESNDQVTEVSYKNGSGDVGQVIDGMTCIVGSTAGGQELGTVRVRSMAAGVLTIGETSDVVWASDSFLTIVDDFDIWSRRMVYQDRQFVLEGDVPYVDQFEVLAPIPVMGPTFNVLHLVGETVSLPMDGSNSWVPGGTVSDYLWTGSGPAAVTFDDATAAAPELTFDAAGLYRIQLTVTANGRENSGYRYVYVYDDAHPLISDFRISKLPTSQSDGGMSFSVEWFNTGGASLSERAVVVVVAEETYGDTAISLGPIPGYEHLFTIGRIESDSIDANPELGKITFEVKGNAWWLQNTPAWPFTLQDTHLTLPGVSPMAVSWAAFDGLTADVGLWCLALYRSTMAKCMDIYPSGDTTRVFGSAGNLASLWASLQGNADQIGGTVACDRYGRLFQQVDPQLVPTSDRGGIPVVMELTKQDWSGQIIISRRQHPATSRYDMAGTFYDGNRFETMRSIAPGNSLMRSGGVETKSNLMVASQARGNELAGLLLARSNNPIPVVDITLAGNNRLIDIAPAQYLTLSLAAEDSPSGIVWTSKKLIVRRMDFTYESENGYLQIELECEPETSGPAGVTIAPPQSSPSNNPPPSPPPPGSDPGWIPNTWFPPVVPPIVGTCGGDTGFTNMHNLGFDPLVLGGPGGKFESFCYFPCSIRAGNVTYIQVYADFIGADESGDPIPLSLVAVDANKNPILSSILEYFTWHWHCDFRFDPATCTPVAGFKLVLPGSGTYIPGTVISSGSFNSADYTTGAPVSVTPGRLYCVESSGGPWYDMGYPPTHLPRYMFSLMSGSGGGMDSWIGKAGVDGYGNPTAQSMGDAKFAEMLPDGLHGRIYFLATQPIYWIMGWPEMNPPSDYSGTEGFTLREATTSGWMLIRDAWLYNVASL